MLSSCCLPGRRSLFATFVAAFALAGVAANAVQAQEQEQNQPQLSASLLSAESLDEEQQQQIVQFADYYVEQIRTSDDPTDISDARQRLLDPLRNRSMTGSTAHEALSDALANALQATTESDDVKVRINALIVAAELSSSIEQVIPLLIDSLDHEHPAVRYRAARTITRISTPSDDEEEEDSALSREQQTQLLESLSGAINDESSDMALEALYEAAGSFTIPQARQVLLSILSERAGNYTGGLHQGIQADQQGLASLQASLEYDRALDRDVDDALRQLTVIAARFLDVITRELQDGRVPEGLTPVAVQTVLNIEDTFDLAVQHFDSAASSDALPLFELADDGEYEQLRQNALNWIGSEEGPGLLSESGIGIPRDQLELQAER